jgi:DNA (cytosine-5)-methyltransferase 1
MSRDPSALDSGGSPRLLDLFCGAGGAARGYQRAGFYVIGMDIKPQPRYAGDEFIQADALTFPLELLEGLDIDAVHASPPCQSYIRGGLQGAGHPDLLPATRERIRGLAYVIENVPGAPMRCDVMLCGSMFGLPVRRHRWFESNIPVSPFTLSCDHSRPIHGVYGALHGKAGAWPGMLPDTLESRRTALGIDWMNADELALAIPPAYTEHIGQELMAHLIRERVA